MKTYRSISIFMGMASMLLLLACEKAEIQKSEAKNDLPLELRGDCQDCPGLSECCCEVWMQVGETDANLAFCGTSDGIDARTGEATTNCPSFQGGYQAIALDVNNPREPFCVNQNSPFWVANLDGSGVANIIITCQRSATAPDTMHFQLGAGARRYVETDGSCGIGPCN